MPVCLCVYLCMYTCAKTKQQQNKKKKQCAVKCIKVYWEVWFLFEVIPSEVQENAGEAPERPGKWATYFPFKMVILQSITFHSCPTSHPQHPSLIIPSFCLPSIPVVLAHPLFRFPFRFLSALSEWNLSLLSVPCHEACRPVSFNPG